MTKVNSEKSQFKIICHGHDGRVIASLDMKGCLTIHHDHFSDEEGYDIEALVKAFDKFTHRRMIHHSTKKGLNQDTIDIINKLQQEKPGKVLFPDSV
jgi:hypothetical protein